MSYREMMLVTGGISQYNIFGLALLQGSDMED